MTDMSTAPDGNGSRATQAHRLGLLLGLNLLLIGALVVVGLIAHSVAVLAAGGDFVADSLAIVLGLVAVHLRDRHGKTHAPSYVALVNGVFLLAVTGWVLVESVHRLLVGAPQVEGLPVLIVAAVSTVAMVLGAVILGAGAASEDLHMRSVLLDTLSDALSSAAVVIVGAVIFVTHGLYWLDPAVGVLIGAVIGYGAIRLLRDVVNALRTGQELDLDDD